MPRWQPNRNYQSPSYRYGFNGMEKDDEVKGSGNSYTTQFRAYDPRIGRWLSLDPMMAKYPHQSPFAGFNNNPIFFADPTGLEGAPPDKFYSTDGELLHDDKVGDNNYIVSHDNYCKAIDESDDVLEISEKLRVSAKQAYTSSKDAAKAWAPKGFFLTKEDENHLERAAGILKGEMEDGTKLFVLGNTVVGRKSDKLNVKQEVDPLKSKAIVGGINLLDEEVYSYLRKIEIHKYNPYHVPLFSSNPVVDHYYVASMKKVWTYSGFIHTHPPGDIVATFSASAGGRFGNEINGDLGFVLKGYDVYLVPTTNEELTIFYLVEAKSIHSWYRNKSIIQAGEEAKTPIKIEP